jgi:phage protein D
VSTGSVGVELQTDNDSANDITAFVSEFLWRDSMLEGGFTWGIVFTATDWNEWQDFVRGREKSQWRFRLKSVEGSATPNPAQKTTDYRRAVVDSSRFIQKGETGTFQVKGADVRLLMAQNARTRAFPGSTISDIITQVAGEYNLLTDVDTTQGTRDRWQLREDDWTHMKRLSLEAATTGGRGDAYLWLDDTRLRFKAPALAAASSRLHDLSEVENRIERVGVSYNGREVDRKGGATLLGIGFDFRAGQSLPFTLNVSTSSALPALARQVPRAMENGFRVMTTSEEDAKNVQEGVAATWMRAATRYFTLRLDTRPDLTLKPGVIVEIQSALDSATNLPFFGRYCVLEVQHKLVGSYITTTAVCFRREAQVGEEDATGANVSATGVRDPYRYGQPENQQTIVRAQVLQT